MSRRYCTQCYVPLDANEHRLYCLDCRSAFQANLRQIPDLLRELNTTLSKQDRISSGSGGGSRPVGHAPPLFYKKHASEARDRLIAQGLVKWARIVRVKFQMELASNMPQDPIERLLAYTDRASQYTWFGDMAEEVARLVTMSTDAIDLARVRLEAGCCDHCGTRMSGRLDLPTVECSGCSTVYDIADRQRDLWAAAQAHEVTAAQAEVYLGYFMRLGELRKAEGLPPTLAPLLDQPFNGALVRQWARRGHIGESGRYISEGITPAEGWPLYFFGDIITVAMSQLDKAIEGKRNADARRAARAAARSAREMVSSSAA